MEQWLTVLTFAAAVGSCVVGGIFYGFSTFIMGALGRLPAPHGIAAMQAINVVVINPLFLGLFMGLVPACIAVCVMAGMSGGPGAAWLIAGALLYVVGNFGVTIACNVPLNNALERVAPDSAEGATLWAHYLRRWTMWNHVRTIAGIAGGVVMGIGLV